MLSAIPLWIHLLAAATWVGAQVMMVAVVVPSVRPLGPDDRHTVMTRVTTRFGYLGLASLLFLVVTGIDNISRFSPDNMFDMRYGYILATKIALVIAVVLLTAYHAMVVGPRLLALQTEAPGDVEGARKLRARSIAASSMTLLFSIIILFCAALLNTRFAFADV